MVNEQNKAFNDEGKIVSRKFAIALISICLMTGVTVGGFWFAPVVGLLPTLVGGILGALGLYLTGNVVDKHVIGKNVVSFEGSKTVMTHETNTMSSEDEKTTLTYEPEEGRK